MRRFDSVNGVQVETHEDGVTVIALGARDDQRAPLLVHELEQLSVTLARAAELMRERRGEDPSFDEEELPTGQRPRGILDYIRDMDTTYSRRRPPFMVTSRANAEALNSRRDSQHVASSRHAVDFGSLYRLNPRQGRLVDFARNLRSPVAEEPRFIYADSSELRPIGDAQDSLWRAANAELDEAPVDGD